MPNYTVKQGDCISSIADEKGFFWETIWNDAGNDGLKSTRQNPNALEPGDVLFIPEIRKKEESCAPTMRHTFRLKGVPVRLNFRLLDKDDKPRAGIPYTLEIDGKKKDGTVPADGNLSEIIKPNAKKAKLTLTPPDAPKEEYIFDLGYMNPKDDPKGVQGRLKNLGYYRGDINGTVDEATKHAISQFQQDSGLEPTGEIDDATSSALAQKHGG